MPDHLLNIMIKLFADDTTILLADNIVDNVKKLAKSALLELVDWCLQNKLLINWDKTYFMIISNKRIKKFKNISFNRNSIQITSNFKLLGV